MSSVSEDFILVQFEWQLARRVEPWFVAEKVREKGDQLAGEMPLNRRIEFKSWVKVNFKIVITQQQLFSSETFYDDI